VIFLMGPTASGKSSLAIRLARRLPVEIISVDSGMVYRDMDIGTAKPAREILQAVPHRLVDIRDPAESYSAGQFRLDALREIADIRAAGRVPLLVGGTNLYFRALRDGLSGMPSADPAVRARLNAEAAEQGWPALHRRLAAVDPEAAARISPNDPQRIQRALEVYELTGQPISRFHGSGRMPGPPAIQLAVSFAERERQRTAIAERFYSMMAEGFLDEVERLYRRGDLHPDLPSMRLVGYRQAWAHLAGELDRDEMTRKAVVATQQLGKRQLTWLRSEKDLEWFDAADAALDDKILKFVHRDATLKRTV